MTMDAKQANLVKNHVNVLPPSRGTASYSQNPLSSKDKAYLKAAFNEIKDIITKNQSGNAVSPFKNPPDKTTSFSDKLKARSSLIGLFEPAMLAYSAAFYNREKVLGNLIGMGKAVFSWDLDNASKLATNFSKEVFWPGGVAGTLLSGAYVIDAAADGAVGIAEVVDGIKHKNKFLSAMGVLDIIKSAPPVLLVGGYGILAVALAVGVAIAKGVLVANSPSKEVSHIQKADAVFSIVGQLTANLMKAGIFVLPAFITSILKQGIQLSYMNSEKVQSLTHKMLSKIKTSFKG